MTLELKARIRQIAGDLSTFTVEDVNIELPVASQYAQGANPIRADLGVFMYVTKKGVGDVADSLIYTGIDNSDPENAASWIVPYTEDNWYEHAIIAAKDWTSVDTYLLNDVVYYVGKLYIATAGNINSSPDLLVNWADVTEDHNRILDNGLDNHMSYEVYNDGLTQKTEVFYSKEIAKKSKNGQCLDCDSDEERVILKLEFHLNAAAVALYTLKYTQMQWNIETLKAVAV